MEIAKYSNQKNECLCLNNNVSVIIKSVMSLEYILSYRNEAKIRRLISE